MTSKIKSVTSGGYATIRLISKIAKRMLFASAILIFVDVVRNMCGGSFGLNWGLYKIVMACQVLCLFGYHIMTVIASVLHFDATKKKYPDLVDDVYGTNLSPEKSANYYSSSKMTSSGGKMAYDIAENCFFSYRIMLAGIKSHLMHLGIVLLFFMVALIIDQSSVFLTVLRLTVPVIWIKNTVVYFYALHQLGMLDHSLHNLLNRKADSEITLMADSIRYSLTYESLMAWLNTPVSEKIYIEKREAINEEFEKRASNYPKQ